MYTRKKIPKAPCPKTPKPINTNVADTHRNRWVMHQKRKRKFWKGFELFVFPLFFLMGSKNFGQNLIQKEIKINQNSVILDETFGQKTLTPPKEKKKKKVSKLVQNFFLFVWCITDRFRWVSATFVLPGFVVLWQDALGISFFAWEWVL